MARIAVFASTHWSVVTSSRAARTSGGHESFAILCDSYWYPLFAFLRRKGHTSEDAEDLVQSFFAWLWESDVIGRADRERGRFRTFLIVALKQFVERERRYSTAQKRKPAGPIVSLSREMAEGRYQLELSDDRSPEREFEYRWAMSLLERAMQRLQAEYVDAGKEGRFLDLAPLMTNVIDSDYQDTADRLGMQPGTLRVAVHRLKQRYGAILREEVANTVADPKDVDDELLYVTTLLGQAS